MQSNLSSLPPLPKLQTSLSYISYIWSHVRAEVFWKTWDKLDEAFLDSYRNWSILLNRFFLIFFLFFTFLACHDSKATWAGKFHICQNCGFSLLTLAFQVLLGARRIKSVKGAVLFAWLSFSFSCLMWWSCDVYWRTSCVITRYLSIAETEG